MLSAHRWARVPVFAGLVAALFAMFTGFGLLATESLPAAMAAGALGCAFLCVHLVVHECGHLVAALVLRLPVLAVRIAPFTGSRNAVLVRLDPETAALPLRMAAFYLAGPLANLLSAAALCVGAVTVPAAVPAVALACGALLALSLGLANLVPGLSSARDGSGLLLWLRHPSEARAAVRAVCYQVEVRRAVRALATGDGLAADSGPVRALVAYRQQWLDSDARWTAEFVAAAEQLAALARAEDTDPATAAAIAQVLSVQFGLLYLHAAATGAPVPHREVQEIAELADLASRVRPDALPARVAAGLAHLLNGHPERARSLLADVGADPEQPDLREVAVIVRHLAQGRLGAAGGPVPATGDRYPQLTRVAAGLHAADPKPAMFVAAPAELPTG